MATPRKRYFKVADQILAEPWPRELKLALVLLMAHLNTRWARDGIPDADAGRCTLSSGAAFDITGKSYQRSQVKLLQSLSDLVSISIEVRGEFIVIDWPKFAEFQYVDARSQGSSRAPSRAPSAAAAAAATSSRRVNLFEQDRRIRGSAERSEPKRPELRPVPRGGDRPDAEEQAKIRAELAAIQRQLRTRAAPKAPAMRAHPPIDPAALEALEQERAKHETSVEAAQM